MKNKNMNQKGISSILIILIVVGVLTIGGVVWYYQKTLQIVSQPIPQITLQNETTNWETYIFPSIESEILPNISLKYPPFFNKIKFYSRKTRNGIEIITDDWGGFIDFRSTPNLFSGGLRLVFFKKINNKENFEKYVESQLDERWGEQNKWDSIKYFQVDGHKAARTRFSTPDQYSSNNSYYYIELSNGNILEVNADGDKVFVYDDKEGDSTRDRIISNFKFIATNETAEITVISPDGREVWKIGTEHTISWIGGKGNTISAMLLKENGDTFGWIFSSGEPNGFFIWNTETISWTRSGAGEQKSIQPGKYKVRVLDDYGNSDESDASFSIVASE